MQGGRASDPGKTLRLTEPVAGATFGTLLHSSLFQLRSYGQRTGQIVQRLECHAPDAPLHDRGQTHPPGRHALALGL